ncbi:MAG: hypothetical protein JWO05_2185 [Gemmatimonadetes bacterium]|nr:hypothetical protein [Gemmatimonadota bacterium]
MRRFLLPLLALPIACGDSSTTSAAMRPQATGTGTRPFTALPLSLTNTRIVALGAMNGSQHTLPTDHIYFYGAIDTPQGLGSIGDRPVYAIADGLVQQVNVTTPPGDVKVWIGVTSTFRYYYGHLFLDAGIVEGTKVLAGQRIGHTGTSGALDLGVVNDQHDVGYVAPDRYGETGHTQSPLSFYTEPLRTQLYALVKRDGPEKDGRINYDIAGTLSGNWFRDNLPLDTRSFGGEGWGHQASFAFDVYAPSVAKISIGGELAVEGQFDIPVPEIPWASVTVASGMVTYRLTTIDPNYPERRLNDRGWLLAQMLSSSRVKLEAFLPGPKPVAFTVAAREYIR